MTSSVRGARRVTGSARGLRFESGSFANSPDVIGGLSSLPEFSSRVDFVATCMASPLPESLLLRLSPDTSDIFIVIGAFVDILLWMDNINGWLHPCQHLTRWSIWPVPSCRNHRENNTRSCRQYNILFTIMSLPPSPCRICLYNSIILLLAIDLFSLLTLHHTLHNHVVQKGRVRDPATFHEVFSSETPHLYDMMFEHPALLHVPQFLLASEAKTQRSRSLEPVTGEG